MSKPSDRLKFFYRDEIFTDKFLGGEYLIRNDYEQSQLHPPNKEITDSEIINIGPTPLPILGDLGRLSRMIGLFLDRIVDSRESLLELFDPRKIDVESIEDMVGYLGHPGFDLDNWNVDKQHRFLNIMPYILRRGGTLDSYLQYIRFLGFLATESPLVSRRRWDSVYYHDHIDLRVPAVYLDMMGSMDTSDSTSPLAFLRFRFYKRSTKSRLGATSIPANRLLTDATATFSSTCQVGNLIHVNDPDSTDEWGEFIVTEIHSDTVLKIDQDWPVGSKTNLVYSNNWEVPWPDPDSDFILERTLDISPDSMRVMHIDDSI